MAKLSSSCFVIAVLCCAAHLGAADESKNVQLGRHMLQLGVNGAAFARPQGARCVIGPTCAQTQSSPSSSSPSPSPTNASGRRHLIEATTADLSGAIEAIANAAVGRHVLQTGFNGAAYARPQKKSGRSLLHELTGLF